MRKNNLILIVVAAFTLIVICLFQLLPPSDAGRNAVDKLVTVHTFSFGGTGYSGLISDGEDEFFAVLASRHSINLFCDLYERGTPEAKLYALCGLRLANGDFDKYADRFVRDGNKITNVSGCLVGTSSASNSVALIKQGLIESYLPLRLEIERARIQRKMTNAKLR